MELLDAIFVMTLYYIIGIVLITIYEILTKDMEIRISGVKLHHSLWGVVLIVIGSLLHSFLSPIYLVTVGMSIIAQHTLTEKKLIFLES